MYSLLPVEKDTIISLVGLSWNRPSKSFKLRDQFYQRGESELNIQSALFNL